MKVPFVDLKLQYKSIKDDINHIIKNSLENTNFIGGKDVLNFEKKFAKFNSIDHCISVANGTDSLYIILKSLDIGQNDEVITVSNSWISSSETITQAGAKPVFVDIDIDYYTINEELIEKKINDKTKAILVVHLYGQMSEMNKIKKIADKNGLFLIEDCAQSHFSSYNKKLAGTIGDAGSFSFYPGKNLGAYGDAGCIITNNEKLAIKCRMFARHGALIKHKHEIEGINSRMDSIQAAILSYKLDYIMKWTQKRISNAKLYYDKLSKVNEIILPKIRPNSKHTFHLFVVRVKDRDSLVSYLSKKGISTSIHYPTPLPFLKAYKYLNHKPSDFPNNNLIHNEILSLPMFPELSSEQIDYVSNSIIKFYEK